MKLAFPRDRSIQEAAAVHGRVSVALTVGNLPGAAAADFSILAHRLAFACLYVYSRMLQQPALCMSVYRAGQPSRASARRHVSWKLDEDQTLADSVSTLAWSPTPDANLAEIAAVLCMGSVDSHDDLRDPGERVVVSAVPGEGGVHWVSLEAHFDEARITPASARDLLEKMALVCEALDWTPHLRTRRLELLTPTAMQSVPDLRRELAAAPQALVPHVLRDVARRCWNEAAISGKGGTYTYGALWMQAAHLANQLRAQGLAPADVVAIAGASSFGTISAMLATLLVGGVIVTLDPSLPAERLSRMAAICQPRVTVSVRAVKKGGSVSEPSHGQLVVMDWPARGHAPLEADWPDFEIGDAITDDARAYVFFTSGSTGEPKGVLGSHLGLAHFLNWQRSHFPIGPGDRSAQLTALSFDVVLRDIFFPLTSGACLCIPERDSLFDARRILGWMSSSKITVMHCVPSVMKAWLQADHGERPLRSMRRIFFAGEPLTDTLLARVREAACPGTLIANLYGPTETTLAKLCNVIEQVEPGVQPVGHPQPGVDAFVMRERSVRCGLWEVGEIVIRTPYRSKGYLGQESLTRQVFIPNPWRNDPADLLYFTGDLGRLRPDGKIEIFGRIDSQIKIRGVRIEPNEIESELARIDFVEDAAVSARVNSMDEKLLVAFVVLRDRADAAANAMDLSQRIRSRLRSALHDAMVPGQIVFMNALPRLPNGKLDRKAINALDSAVADDGIRPAARLKGIDAAHLPAIAEIESVLGRSIGSMDQSFVDLGGDSLSYVRVSLVLEESLGTLPTDWEKIPLRTLLGSAPAPAADATRSAWVSIEMPLLFRAVAILLVVLNHTNALSLSGSTVLFVVSGISFGKFMRPTIFQTGSLEGVFRFILGYGVPAALWQLLRWSTDHPVWLPDLLLIGTMFQEPGNPHWTFWYLDILTAIVLLFSGISALEVRRRGANEAGGVGRRFRIDFSLILVGMVLAVAQVSTGWWDGPFGVSSLGPFRWFWLFAYGVAVSQVSSLRHKILLTALLALPLVATGLRMPMLGPTFDFLDAFFFGAMPAILWLESIRIPRALKGVVVEVASASLFIYIVNVAVIDRLPAWPPVQALAAVSVGVVAYRAWGMFTAALAPLYRRARRAMTMAA